jgi:hypothetical protein
MTFKIWPKSLSALFLHSRFKRGYGLTHGVTVALQILVLSVKVRILMGQQAFFETRLGSGFRRF